MKVENRLLRTKRIITLSIVIVLLIFVNYLIMDHVKETRYKEAYQDDWAIYNYGQIVGEKGKEGIDINIIPILDEAKGEKSVLVGVVDTGVDTDCNIFAANTMIEGWDFYNSDSSIFDDYIHDYHGTYVCTTIARIAPRVSIIPVKFMEGTTGAIEDAVQCIDLAIEKGAQIINCSWNFYDYNKELYDVMRNHPQVLFVCAAGNYNANIDETQIYPCSYQLNNVINVLAVDNTGQLHSTSGYGKKTVHIGAPGAAVKVILPENEELYIDGTSVAAAFVSGTAALLLSENPKLNAENLRNIIVSSARPLKELSTKCIYGGIIDVSAAIEYLRKEK